MTAASDAFNAAFGAARPRFFSIDSNRPFLEDFAQAFSEALDKDPLAIASSTVLTPTRRSARALGDVFRRLAAEQGVRATVLPSIRPLGDIDEDEWLIAASADDVDIDFAPPVSGVERRLILAQLVAARDRAFAGAENWPAALAAASELAKLLDSFYTEEIAFSALKTVVPAQFAEHWSRSLDFLEIVVKAWPAYLESADRTDPADRIVKRIDALERRWRATPPSSPVAVIGSTGSAPAVARLLKTVADFDRGLVVLPGLDRTLAAEDAWSTIDDPHPQAGLRALLNSLEVDRTAIRRWPSPYADDSADGSERRRLLSMALRPAEATEDWRRLPFPDTNTPISVLLPDQQPGLGQVTVVGT
ncbi:MAG: hypothetical protein AAGJ87_11005, partial [Pseudomonadota bacterium]